MGQDEPNYTSHPETLRRGAFGVLNVEEAERVPSLAGGALLTMLGLARRGVVGALCTLVGGVLLYRGATGNCRVYQALGIDTAAYPRTARGKQAMSPERVAVKPNRSERVEEASWESFPASDPPSWSGGAVT